MKFLNNFTELFVAWNLAPARIGLYSIYRPESEVGLKPRVNTKEDA